ncbi:hypothetical protein GCM10009617_19260 [Leifsonia poae]
MLLFTGAFHVLRGAPVDAWIFFGVAILVTLESLGWLRVPLSARADRTARGRPIAVAGALIATLVAVLAVSPLYGGADTAIVVGLGLVLLPIAWAAPPSSPPSSAPSSAPSSTTASAEPARIKRAAIVWSVIIAAGCAWEITAFLLGRNSPGGSTQFPALSDLVDPLLADPFGRTALVALWLVGGYALIRRGRRR